MVIVAVIIDYILRIFMLLVFVYVILSYFMSPYHPVRRRVDSLMEPILAPIRRIIPPLGPVDLSPIVLIVGLQLLKIIIQSILR